MNFKTPLAGLVPYLYKAKEKWKARAIENQQELRRAKIRIRDLEASRDKWKERAKQTEHLVKTEIKYEEKVTVPEAQSEDITPKNSIVAVYNEPPKFHSYPLYTIYMSVCFVIQSISGFRGSERNLKIIGEVMGSKVPCYSTIRLWTYRLGLYILLRQIEYRVDRTFIIDMTVELGNAKCMLILGVNASRFEQPDFCLTQHDTEVLEIKVLTQTSGVIVAKCLEDLSARIGIPKAIVSDQGSDIKKGIEIYQSNHPDVIYTPDISHKIACLVKQLLKNDEIYQSLNTKCNQVKSEIQQTELNFLKPPIQRSKARYHHIAPRIEWAKNILNYRDRSDFNLIDPRYSIDNDTLRSMSSSYQRLLESIVGLVFDTRDEFDCAMNKMLGEGVYQECQYELRRVASIGRQRFNQKFGWVSDFENELPKYQQILEVIKCCETQLKHEGLHNESAQRLEKKLDGIVVDEKAKILQTQINEYINVHHRDAPPTQARLASSDIIESVLGQFKYVGDSGCLQEIGEMILLIPLLVTKITPALVFEAMQSIKTCTLDAWAENIFGQSGLGKRKAVFCC